MNETYKELLVKKESGLKDKFLRVICLVATIMLGMISFLTGNIGIFIITVGLGVLTYFVFMWTDLEYEYVYLDKEITVDKIMGKTKRKRVATIDVNKMEILAPANSHELDSYKNRQVKPTDYSAGHDLPEMKLYNMYYDGNAKFVLNLDEEFVKTVKGIAPRKVFTY